MVANFAFANRSALTHRLRQTLAVEMDVEARLLYDVSHNIAKQEVHEIHGAKVHMYGAQRVQQERCQANRCLFPETWELDRGS